MQRRKQSFWYVVLLVAPFVWTFFIQSQLRSILMLNIVCPIILLIALISYLLNRQEISDDRIYSCLKYFGVFCLYMVVVSTINRNTVFGLQISLVISSVFTFSFLGQSFKRFTIIGYIYAAIAAIILVDFLAGGYTGGWNTNSVALLAINGVMYLCLINDVQENKLILINAAFAAVLLVLISLTGCRSVIVAFIMFVVLRYLLFINKKISRIVYSFICTAVMILPYIITRVYINLSKSNMRQTLDMWFINHTGKKMFTDRDIIWNDVLGKLSGKKYWFGTGHPDYGTHNIVVDIWNGFGFIGVIMFALLFLLILYALYKYFQDPIIKSSVCCFLGVYVSETFESMAFSIATVTYNILLYLFIAIAIGRYVNLCLNEKHIKELREESQ